MENENIQKSVTTQSRPIFLKDIMEGEELAKYLNISLKTLYESDLPYSTLKANSRKRHYLKSTIIKHFQSNEMSGEDIDFDL